jgi:2-aminoadipate transaminase
MRDLGGDVVTNMFTVLDKADIISFAGGVPSPYALPVEQLQVLADEILATAGRQVLQYSTIDGYGPLREWIAQWVADRGIQATRDNVLVLSGGQQGIDLSAKVFLNPGDNVLLERPTYLAAITIFKAYEVGFRPVASDEQGIIPESLEEAILKYKPKMLYVVPTFQNPTGVTIPAERRKAIAEIAGKYGVIVVEDDPYALLRYDGDPIPSIASYDTAGVVIHVNSFSKIVSPGLRVGYAVAAPQIKDLLTQAKQTADFHTSNLSQRMIYEFCTRGMLEPHLATVRETYKAKRDAALRAMEKYFPEGVHWTHPDGGLFVWVTLPEHIDTGKLMATAAEHKVAFIPGTPFYFDDTGKNTMRINFSNADFEMLDEGLARLGDVIREAM